MAYGTIDIGSAASNRSTYQDISWLGSYYTYVERGNVANADGILNSCEIWMQSTGANIRVGTFSASGANLTCRDYEVLGNVTSGSKQTFTGLNITVAANDLIGTTGTDGNIEGGGTGSSVYHANEGSQNYTFWDTSAHSYSNGNGPISLYGTGITVPDAPTNVSATDNLTDKVRIVWTPATGETGGHRVYRDGSDISGVVAHTENMVINDGGFESWADANTPGYWAVNGAGGSIDRESTTKKTGSYSVKITRSGANKEVGQTITTIEGHAIAWWVGKTVTIGAWVYCTTASACRLTIWDGDMVACHTYHGGSGWEYLVSTITVGAGATNVNLYCTAVADCVVYCDALSGVFGTAVHDGANGLAIPYDDTTGAAGTTYAYTVKAINDAGLSAASSADNGTKLAEPSFIQQIMKTHYIPSLGGF